MNIKEHGARLRISLYLIILFGIVVWTGETVKNTSEVIMKPTYKHTRIQSQEFPSGKIQIFHKEEIKKAPRYGFTEKDIYLLTVLMCGSAKRDGDGEYDFDFEKEINHKQVSLVLNVVMNRVNSKEFPDNVHDVVWAKNQFSYMYHWKNGLPKVKPESYAIVEAWCRAYDVYDYSVVTIPPNHLYFSGNGKYNKSSERW